MKLAAVIALLLVPALAGAADKKKTDDDWVRPVVAATEKTAAKLCHEHGYAYFIAARADNFHYLCLRTNIGTLDAQDVEEYLARIKRLESEDP